MKLAGWILGSGLSIFLGFILGIVLNETGFGLAVGASVAPALGFLSARVFSRIK